MIQILSICNAMQRNATQRSAIQHIAAQRNAVQGNGCYARQNNAMQCIRRSVCIGRQAIWLAMLLMSPPTHIKSVKQCIASTLNCADSQAGRNWRGDDCHLLSVHPLSVPAIQSPRRHSLLSWHEQHFPDNPAHSIKYRCDCQLYSYPPVL